MGTKNLLGLKATKNEGARKGSEPPANFFQLGLTLFPASTEQMRSSGHYPDVTKCQEVSVGLGVRVSLEGPLVGSGNSPRGGRAG